MSEEINKSYVKHYVDKANSTDNEDLKNDCLYRAGTQMEIIPCDGNANLTPEQQETVLEAAEKFLTSDTDSSLHIFSPGSVIWGDDDADY